MVLPLWMLWQSRMQSYIVFENSTVSTNEVQTTLFCEPLWTILRTEHVVNLFKITVITLLCLNWHAVLWSEINSQPHVYNTIFCTQTYLPYVAIFIYIVNFSCKQYIINVIFNSLLFLYAFIYFVCFQLPALLGYFNHFYLVLVDNYRSYGIITTLEIQLSMIKTHCLFTTYFVTFLIHCLLLRLSVNLCVTTVNNDIGISEIIYFACKESLNAVCGSLIGIVGFACALSIIVQYIIRFVCCYLKIQVGHHENNEGTVMMILFCLLAIQTGLTGLNLDERITKLCRNLCLIVIALFHFIHVLVEDVLLRISAVQSESLGRHIKCLFMLFTVFCVPCFIIIYLLYYSISFGTWTFAVMAICFEIIVQTCVTFALYLLFIVDLKYVGFWNDFDDYVYYTKATGRMMVLIISILLLCNGIYILVFESASIIRAVMIALHAYGNIFAQARSGWKKFILRRSAIKKLYTLPLVTNEEILAYDSPCAICYLELEPRSTRRTICKHLFHGTCLRKWLYIQDKCPMCHQNVYNEDFKVVEKNSDL